MIKIKQTIGLWEQKYGWNLKMREDNEVRENCLNLLKPD